MRCKTWEEHGRGVSHAAHRAPGHSVPPAFPLALVPMTWSPTSALLSPLCSPSSFLSSDIQRVYLRSRSSLKEESHSHGHVLPAWK